MKHLLLTLAILGGTAYAQTEDERRSSLESSIERMCAAEWPGDYSMQEYCQNNQLEGYNEVSAMLQDPPIPENENDRVFSRCAAEWTDGEITDLFNDNVDWQMVAYCMKHQTEAYQRIH